MARVVNEPIYLHCEQVNSWAVFSSALMLAASLAYDFMFKPLLLEQIE